MIDKINKDRRRSMKATFTRHSNKNKRRGAQEDPKQKIGQSAGQNTDKIITEMIIKKKL
jgi:hypothetical protein